ncbi:MAG: DUF2974 domain-containing protein [Clostridiaceae bacterium]|nr:DUF2974 domain-containing protein [Clostridiaceae bacterium]
MGDFMPFNDRELAYASFIAFLDLHKGFDFLSDGSPVLIGDILELLGLSNIADLSLLEYIGDEDMKVIKSYKLVDYYNDNDFIHSSGFYGCLIELDENRIVCALRGSEPMSEIRHRIADWVFADLMLLNSEITFQQKECENFARQIAYSKYIHRYNSMAVAGHSLGGNLACHFAIISYKYGLDDRIETCANFDGPGFSNEYLNKEEHREGIERMNARMFNYTWSFIGALLNPVGEVVYVKANWEGKNFVTVHRLDNIVLDGDYVSPGKIGKVEKYIGDLSRKVDNAPDSVGNAVFVFLSVLVLAGYWLFEYMFDNSGELTVAGYLIVINLLVFLSPYIGMAEAIPIAIVCLLQLQKALSNEDSTLYKMAERIIFSLGDIFKMPQDYSYNLLSETLRLGLIAR